MPKPKKPTLSKAEKEALKKELIKWYQKGRKTGKLSKAKSSKRTAKQKARKAGLTPTGDPKSARLAKRGTYIRFGPDTSTEPWRTHRKVVPLHKEVKQKRAERAGRKKSKDPLKTTAKERLEAKRKSKQKAATLKGRIPKAKGSKRSAKKKLTAEEARLMKGAKKRETYGGKHARYVDEPTIRHKQKERAKAKKAGKPDKLAAKRPGEVKKQAKYRATPEGKRVRAKAAKRKRQGKLEPAMESKKSGKKVELWVSKQAPRRTTPPPEISVGPKIEKKREKRRKLKQKTRGEARVAKSKTAVAKHKKATRLKKEAAQKKAKRVGRQSKVPTSKRTAKKKAGHTRITVDGVRRLDLREHPFGPSEEIKEKQKKRIARKPKPARKAGTVLAEHKKRKAKKQKVATRRGRIKAHPKSKASTEKAAVRRRKATPKPKFDPKESGRFQTLEYSRGKRKESKEARKARKKVTDPLEQRAIRKRRGPKSPGDFASKAALKKAKVAKAAKSNLITGFTEKRIKKFIEKEEKRLLNIGDPEKFRKESQKVLDKVTADLERHGLTKNIPRKKEPVKKKRVSSGKKKAPAKPKKVLYKGQLLPPSTVRHMKAEEAKRTKTAKRPGRKAVLKFVGPKGEKKPAKAKAKGPGVKVKPKIKTRKSKFARVGKGVARTIRGAATGAGADLIGEALNWWHTEKSKTNVIPKLKPLKRRTKVSVKVKKKKK